MNLLINIHYEINLIEIVLELLNWTNDELPSLKLIYNQVIIKD